MHVSCSIYGDQVDVDAADEVDEDVDSARLCFQGNNLVREAGGWRCRVCDTLWTHEGVWWSDDAGEEEGKEP